MAINGANVTIGGKDYPLRWEVGPVREFETLHPSLNGAVYAWNVCSINMSALFGLWHMCLCCKDGSPKMTLADAGALLQIYLDEDHSLDEVYDLIAEAGIAGKFMKRIAEEGKDPNPTAGDGTKPPEK